MRSAVVAALDNILYSVAMTNLTVYCSSSKRVSDQQYSPKHYRRNTYAEGGEVIGMI